MKSIPSYKGIIVGISRVALLYKTAQAGVLSRCVRWRQRLPPPGNALITLRGAWRAFPQSVIPPFSKR